MCRWSSWNRSVGKDYVIRDGQLVGDFEGLYRDFEDPWMQSREDHVLDSRRQVALNWCTRLRDLSPSGPQALRVLEIGCGFGHLTSALTDRGFASIGVDVAYEAVCRARERHPESVFLRRSISDEGLLDDLDPDILIMAEVTWYVLNELSEFLDSLRSFASERNRPTYLIHLLTTYGPGVQTYGRDYFTDQQGILQFFDMNYLEYGQVHTPRSDDPASQGTYFVAELN